MPELSWMDAVDLGIEGRGYEDTASPYDRLPARARGMVTEAVWAQAEYSSGLLVRFVTDSTALHVRWRLRFDLRVRPAPGLVGMRQRHQQWLIDWMIGTHQSGLDLYRRHAGGWLWHGSLLPAGFPDAEATVALPGGGAAEYLLYLPAFNGVDGVQLAVEGGRMLKQAPSRPGRTGRPICFYGTSIVHGATALRPGMTMPAIVGRKLDRPVINLGFCGACQAEPAMAELISEIDAAVFVVDPVPNMSPEMAAERIRPFVRMLRKAHPGIPIVLAEGNVFDPVGRDAGVEPWSYYAPHNRELASVYDALRREGDRDVHLCDGRNLFGPDGEGSHDGVHPTDLGLQHMAARYEKLLRGLQFDVGV